jgi:hypothetical protein
MRARRAVLVLGLVLAGAPACVQRVEQSTSTVEVGELRREDVLRTAVNLPDSFVVVTRPATERDCAPALRDDVMKTMLTLRRSLLIPVQDAAGVAYHPFGDYAAEPGGKYGDQAGEALRVDCSLRRAVGIVTLIVRPH